MIHFLGMEMALTIFCRHIFCYFCELILTAEGMSTRIVGTGAFESAIALLSNKHKSVKHRSLGYLMVSKRTERSTLPSS